MRIFRFSPVILFFALSLVGECFAVPAYPYPFTVKNPDGSMMVIRKVGNEKLHYTVSEDDDLVVQDSLGFWNYADESGKPTGVRAHRRGDRGKDEQKFLDKHRPKGVLKKFLKSRQLQLQKQDSVTVIPRRSSAPFRARINTLDNALSVATRPSFEENITKGESNVLVILVEFSDVKFQSSTPQKDFQSYMNDDGYSENGMRWSVREYFIKNSMGVFKPTIDVAAPVTLSNTRNYYGTKQTPDAAFTEAINIIKNRGDIDFSKYDNDKDKTVDYVYMIFAGVGSADTDEQGAIWPQAGTVNPTINLGSWSNPLYVSWYACSSELSGTMYMYKKAGYQVKMALAGIGVVVHEYSHVLGLPDFYDTQDQTGLNYSTPVIWSLMDLGEYNAYPETRNNPYAPLLSGSAPPRLNAFERFSLGWLTPRVLPKVNGEVEIRGIDQNDAILIPSSNKKEYFMLDYRAKYDSIAPLPNTGLLIWRIAYSQTAWDRNVPNVGDDHRMYLYRADGDITIDSEHYYTSADPNLKGDPFPGTKKVTEFKDFTTYSGEKLGLRIYDIVEGDSSVTFKVEWEHPDPVSSSSEVASSSSVVPPSSSSAVIPPSSSAIVGFSSSSSVTRSSSSIAWPFRSSSSTVALPEIASLAGMLRIEAGVVYVNVPVAGQKAVRVFDVQGHLMLAKAFAGNATSVDLNVLPHGNYVVRIDAGGRALKKEMIRL